MHDIDAMADPSGAGYLDRLPDMDAQVLRGNQPQGQLTGVEGDVVFRRRQMRHRVSYDLHLPPVVFERDRIVLGRDEVHTHIALVLGDQPGRQ